MRDIKLLILCLALLPLASFADGWDDAVYRSIEQSIQAPTFPKSEFKVTNFGASPKATAKANQKAINRTIALCSQKGGGRVVVPEGVYETGAITLKSNVNLVVEKGAKLVFVFDKTLYPIVKTRWEGMDCMNYQPCVYAYGEKNVGLSGEGTLDGSGAPDTWWSWSGKHGYQATGKESQAIGRPHLFELSEAGVPIEERNMNNEGLRPQLVNIYNCDNVLIEGLTMLRSPFWVIHPLMCKNLTVRGVKIWNEGPNGDGCDPESCDGVLIENCTFHTGDDCIAIKSGRNADGLKWNKPSQNIIVRGCTMEDGHGGVVLGSEISGGVRNVFVENCEMDSPNLDRVLRIKTNTCRGGITENVFMRNVKVGQCKESVMRINLNYEPNEKAQRGHMPTVRNVYMENVTCQKSRLGVLINGLEESNNIHNINLKNCSFNGVADEAVLQTGQADKLNLDNVKVNGSLVLTELPYDGHYSVWMAKSEMKRVPHSYLLDFSKKPKWSYVMGIEMEGMLDAHNRYPDGNDDIMAYLKEYPETMISDKGEVTGYKYEDFNLDNIRTAKFIERMQRIYPRKGNEKALKMFFKQLQHQPRTKDGVFWHKAIYANQVWLDGIFMGLPFYTNYTMEYKKGNKKYLDDIVSQIVTTDKRTYDPKTGLWKHAWDETHKQFWANPENGQSKHTWARALGWYTMAMVEVLDALPQDYARRAEVVDLFRKAMTAVVRYQDKATGVWYDVMDVNDPRNYLEATASSMFTYCLLKGARLGYLDGSFLKAGQKAYAGLLKQFVRVNDDKTISLTRCCSVSGLGPGPGPYVQPGRENYKRDGSFDYYMSEPIRDNDPKGVGPFIWASLEMEK